ncbi:MAG TPA: O-antigen ligase family protein [Dehalococcoidia bacterium]|nr:O-antigen ligase family protein [Dehalococcoidia bacterium]
MAVLRRSLSLPRPHAAPPAEAWLVAGVLAAVVFGCAALFGRPALFGCAAAGSLAAGIAFYEPRTIGPMLVLALPLEISKLAFPFLQTRTELGGGLPPTSVVDAGRLVAALAFAVWLIRPARPRADVLPVSPLTLPLALLFAVYALSTTYAIDPAAARTETLRLLSSLGTFALVPFFVRDRMALRWTLFTFIFTAAALAIAGIYQEATNSFFWNPGLGLYGQRRINATFADPNHFARLLVEALVVALTLWLFVGRRAKFGFLLPAMGVCVMTLVFTGSRGAWVVAAVTLPVAVLALPVERRLRMRMLGMGAALLVVASIAVAALNPYFAKRLDTFTFGFQAAGARPYLVQAGLNMFADHPVTGVGIGGYQEAFQDDYYSYKDPKIKANVTISHTAAVTIMAELGLIGMASVAFVALRWALYLRDLLRRAPPELKAVLIAMALLTVVIFLGSQTEGRFLEDPYLWLAAGIAVAVEPLLGRAPGGDADATAT